MIEEIDPFKEYTAKWKYKFYTNIPLQNAGPTQYIAYVKRIFQAIVGFNKFANGFWATKGDDIALKIINKCNENNLLLEELSFFLQETLIELHTIPSSSSFIRNLPTTNGNTAMRILHCLDVLGGKICNTPYEIPQPPSFKHRLQSFFS